MQTFSDTIYEYNAQQSSRVNMFTSRFRNTASNIYGKHDNRLIRMAHVDGEYNGESKFTGFCLLCYLDSVDIGVLRHSVPNTIENKI